MSLFFFFNDTATTEIYTLSLHDALPIWVWKMLTTKLRHSLKRTRRCAKKVSSSMAMSLQDRKSTRLNSSHSQISYAVFCLKKKKKQTQTRQSDILRRRHPQVHSLIQHLH